MKKNLFLILGAVLVACLLLFAAKQGMKNKVPNGMVRIYVGGKLYAQEQLSTPRDIPIIQPDGKKNILYLMEDGFYMKESTCLTQQCIKQGQVTLDNYYKRSMGVEILCAHHQVKVELVLTDRTPVPDLPDI